MKAVNIPTKISSKAPQLHENLFILKDQSAIFRYYRPAVVI